MGEARPGKHRPKEGNWRPAPKGQSGFYVMGKTSLKALGRLFGWDNPGRDNG